MKEQFKKLEVEWQEKQFPLLIKRPITPHLTTDVLAIIGPRRVGKTYFMYQLLQGILKDTSKEEILFIDFEDNRLVGVDAHNVDEMFVAHKELFSKEVKYLFFDEIQALPSWSHFIRKLHNQQKYIIIISGSSAGLLGKEIATELRGRYKSVFITPFSFKEFLKIKNVEYTPALEFSSQKGALLKLFQEYFKDGGYPEIIKESEKSEKRQKMNSYFQTIFYKDIVERHHITNYNILEHLMNYILNNVARVFSVTQFEKILKEMGLAVSKKTISLYLTYLAEAFFVYTIEEFSYSPKKRIMRPKKVYAIDNGLVTFLSSQFGPDLGRLLENGVLLELKRRGKEVYYFNDQRECDFIIKEGNNITQVIQVCYDFQPHNQKRELQGLEGAMKTFKLQQGLLLTYDQEKRMEIEGTIIQVLPVWKWLLMESR